MFKNLQTIRNQIYLICKVSRPILARPFETKQRGRDNERIVTKKGQEESPAINPNFEPARNFLTVHYVRDNIDLSTATTTIDGP